jgi:hypothetical protein
MDFKLNERPVTNAAPMPDVFRLIIENDNRRREIMLKGSAMTQEEWLELRRLNHDKKHNLRPSAERALSWNVDKGHDGSAR